VTLSSVAVRPGQSEMAEPACDRHTLHVWSRTGAALEHATISYLYPVSLPRFVARKLIGLSLSRLAFESPLN
jgi:hypothetical protein